MSEPDANVITSANVRLRDEVPLSLRDARAAAYDRKLMLAAVGEKCVALAAEVARLNVALTATRADRAEAQQRLADVVEEVQKREDSQDRIRRQMTAEIERLRAKVRTAKCDNTCTTDCGHCKGKGES